MSIGGLTIYKNPAAEIAAKKKPVMLISPGYNRKGWTEEQLREIPLYKFFALFYQIVFTDCLVTGEPMTKNQEFYAREIASQLLQMYNAGGYPQVITAYSWSGNLLARVLYILGKQGKPYKGQKVLIEPPLNGIWWPVCVFVTPLRFPLWHAAVRSMLRGWMAEQIGGGGINHLPVAFLDTRETILVWGCGSHSWRGLQGWISRLSFDPYKKFNYRICVAVSKGTVRRTEKEFKKIKVRQFKDLDHGELLNAKSVAVYILSQLWDVPEEKVYTKLSPQSFLTADVSGLLFYI